MDGPFDEFLDDLLSGDVAQWEDLVGVVGPGARDGACADQRPLPPAAAAAAAQLASGASATPTPSVWDPPSTTTASTRVPEDPPAAVAPTAAERARVRARQYRLRQKELGNTERLRAANTQRQRVFRAKSRAQAQDLPAQLDAAAAELAALRVERAALSQQHQALSRLAAYSEEVMDVVIAARAAARQREAAEKEGAHAWLAGPKQLLAAFASLVVKVLPPAACRVITSTPSQAQVRRVMRGRAGGGGALGQAGRAAGGAARPGCGSGAHGRAVARCMCKVRVIRVRARCMCKG
jgi:hypothetical protein